MTNKIYPHTIRLPLGVHQALTDAADALGMQPAVLARLLIIQGLESGSIRLPARDRVRRCA